MKYRKNEQFFILLFRHTELYALNVKHNVAGNQKKAMSQNNSNNPERYILNKKNETQTNNNNYTSHTVCKTLEVQGQAERNSDKLQE